MGDGDKLLTYLNSALKVLLGLDIFPRVPKKKVKFCCPVLLNNYGALEGNPVLMLIYSPQIPRGAALN